MEDTDGQKWSWFSEIQRRLIYSGLQEASWRDKKKRMIDLARSKSEEAWEERNKKLWAKLKL